VFALAWRNLWRKRGRSLLTAAAIGLVVFFTLLFYGFGGAAMNGLYTRLTQRLGHLQVQVEGYREIREFADGLIRDSGAVRQRIAATLPEAEMMAALDVPGLLEGEGRSRGILLTGMAQSPELRARYAEDYLIAGELPQEDDLEGIALGGRLAQALQVGLGDTVYMYAPGTEGYGAAAYTVVGLLDLSEPTLDARAALVSLAAAQELAAPDAASRFGIYLPDFTRIGDDERLPTVRHELEAALGGGYAVETWREVEEGLAGYMELFDPIMAVYNAIFFILAGLLVMNTIYLGLIERIREFGVIMALGAGRRKVMGMVLSESLLLCFAGALIGAALSAVALYFMAQGFSFPGPLGDAYAEFGLPRVFYATITPMQVAITVAFTFATAVLAALIPAWTAGRLEPVEAMRFTA
jgi:ABC-type lipoprotein release transport system permease subunit